MLARITRLVQRRARTVLVAAVGFVLLAGATSAGIEKRLVPAAYEASSNSGSAVASRELNTALERHYEPTVAVVANSRLPMRAPRARREIARLVSAAQRIPRIAHVDSVLSRGDELLSKDGRTSLLLLYTDREYKFDQAIVISNEVERNLRSDVINLEFTGYGPASAEFSQNARSDLIRAELISFPLLALLLVFFFRGLVAAMIPLTIAVLGISGSLLLLRVLSEFTVVSIFALNMTTVLGVGLAIDYSLLIVSRYREEIAGGELGYRALAVTMATAGKTVLYSGLTVAVAMASLLVFPQRLLYSLGASGALIALLSTAAALLVVPAALALLGDRVNRLSIRHQPVPAVGKGRLFRLTRLVMRRPVVVALSATALLLVLALPSSSLSFTGLNETDLPRGSETRQAHIQMLQRFGPSANHPVYVTVGVTEAKADPRVTRFARAVEQLPGTAAVAPVKQLDDSVALLDIRPTTGAYRTSSAEHVKQIKQLGRGLPVHIGGRTAEFIDFQSDVGDRLPLALAIMAMSMLIAFFAVTRSVLIPIKALLMNLLTLAATFGVLAWVFVDGHLEGLLDYQSNASLDIPLCIFVLALTFALATDYGVFLMARIVEMHDRGLPDREAVAAAIQTSGRVVTNAALLISVAIGAVVTSGLIALKQAAVGAVVGIIIDATVVRMLLVPALMAILGRWNWWVPKWLARMWQRRTHETSGAAKTVADG